MKQPNNIKFNRDIADYGLYTRYILHKMIIALKYANGCGTKLSWWIPDKILGVDIETACNIHDIECQLAKNKDDLIQASNNFYSNMKKMITFRSGYLFYARIAMAKVYVKAVNFFWLEKYSKERNFND